MDDDKVDLADEDERELVTQEYSGSEIVPLYRIGGEAKLDEENSCQSLRTNGQQIDSLDGLSILANPNSSFPQSKQKQ